MSKKRHEEEEHANNERWLVSYSDFITLLFAFFVVMYSISRIDNKRMAQVVASIKFAMHFKGTGGVEQMPLFEGPPTEGTRCRMVEGTEQKPMSESRERAERLRKRLERRLVRFLQSRAEAVHIGAEPNRVSIRLSATHFFDAGQAAVRPETIPILDAIAHELAELGEPLRVEGHTDDLPLSGSRFRDNWELSSSRASAVASYLQQAHNIDGKRLTAAGFSSTRPRVPGHDAAAREANRRIEIVVELPEGKR